MDFRHALNAAYCSKRITLPEWGGWWYVGKDGLLMVHTKEGTEETTPWFDKYVNRTDWMTLDN